MYSQLPDTPWHVGYTKMKENDTRRHKSRCIYYDHQTKRCITARSPYMGIACAGSAHCSAYSETKDEKTIRKENELKKSVTQKVSKKEIASIGDTVIVRCIDNGEKKSYKLLNNNGKFPEMTLLCVGKNIGYMFSYKGQEYRIVQIEGGVKSQSGKVNVSQRVKSTMAEVKECKSESELRGYQLVAYSGKLKTFVDKKNVDQKFMPVVKNGKNIRVPIQVDKEKKVVYVTMELYEKYKAELNILIL